jgi:uncharacterized protein
MIDKQGGEAAMKKVSHFIVEIPKNLLLLLIRFYRKFISPITPPSCRFTPSCSHYGYDAVEKFGFLKGGWLAIKRIGRCHPFNPGGYDPVP